MPYIPGRATTLIGVRRAGKSTWLRQIARKMVAEGEVPETAIISVNFSDERLAAVTSDSLGMLIEAHAELHPTTIRGTPLVFLLDEIQLVKGWELFVDRLIRQVHHLWEFATPRP